MKKILISVGTRPNIIKITQFKKYAADFGLEVKILHTGQHYDHKMAQVFYDQFQVQPDFRQDLEPGSVLDQITQMMHNITAIIDQYKPDVLLTPGDVNSTFAAAYAAYQANVPIGHIESGLRSDDLTMPEEINRILTDDLTHHFFITEKSGMENLLSLGKSPNKLHLVGNTMIDTLVAFEQQIDQSQILNTLNVRSDFALFTFHRPANVDSVDNATLLQKLLLRAANELTVVFPVHPRTLKMLDQFGLLQQLKHDSNIVLADPLDYFSFQHLVKNATVVVTDSGGIQEETTFRKVPCLTIRPNTERPITVEVGSNILLDFDNDSILSNIRDVKNGTFKSGSIPHLWDGQSTKRILEILS